MFFSHYSVFPAQRQIDSDLPGTTTADSVADFSL